jgi:hypothetical protein
MNRWIVAALCSAVIAGCGASNNDGMIVTADSGTAGGADTGTSVDTGSSTDRGSATTDRGSATTDRGSTTTDSGTASAFGACGESLHTALCTCGNNAMCQQTALQNAVQRSSTCQSCYQSALAGCCPAEIMAIQTCAQDNGCMDQACLSAMCATQLRAADTCLQTAQMSNATCQGFFRRCLGDEFPMLTCGG